MSILFMEGFGACSAGSHPPTDLGSGLWTNWMSWADQVSDPTITDFVSGTTGVRKYLQFPNDFAFLTTQPFENYSATFVIGMRVYRANTNMCLLARLGWNGYIGVTPSGQLRYTRDNDGNLSDGGESWGGTTDLAVGVYNYIEVKVVFGNGTAGEVHFYLNGNAIGSNTGIDTQGGLGGPQGWAHEILMGLHVSSNTTDPDWRFTDIYCSDGEVLGPVEIWYQAADQAGALAEFTPSAGNNEDNVDDAGDPDGDATYNVSTTPGNKDSLGHNVTHILGPDAIMPVATVRCVGSGYSKVRVGVRSGGVESWGPQNRVAQEEYIIVRGPILELDPLTAAAWTPTGSQDAETTIEHMA